VTAFKKSVVDKTLSRPGLKLDSSGSAGFIWFAKIKSKEIVKTFFFHSVFLFLIIKLRIYA